MRKAELIIGVILLIAGAIGFMIGQQTVDNAMIHFPYHEQEINEGNMYRVAGVIFGIIGLVITIVGGVTTKEKLLDPLEHQQPIESVYKQSRYCPKCGRSIPFDAIVCPYCQYDFK